MEDEEKTSRRRALIEKSSGPAGVRALSAEEREELAVLSGMPPMPPRRPPLSPEAKALLLGIWDEVRAKRGDA